MRNKVQTNKSYEIMGSTLFENVIRECVELCARVAEAKSGTDIAAAIRLLKPVARWP
jgi:hypothetical protein